MLPISGEGLPHLNVASSSFHLQTRRGFSMNVFSIYVHQIGVLNKYRTLLESASAQRTKTPSIIIIITD